MTPYSSHLQAAVGFLELGMPLDAAMAKRIDRAALTQEQTVDMWEEAMLLHPLSGEVLEACYENMYTEVDDVLTTPPLGREGEPQFQARP